MNTLVLSAFGVVFAFLCVITHKLGGIMANLAEVKAVLASVSAGVDGLESAIADLKAQVAAGHVITQAELDELHAQAKAIGDDIADTSDQG